MRNVQMRLPRYELLEKEALLARKEGLRDQVYLISQNLVGSQLSAFAEISRLASVFFRKNLANNNLKLCSDILDHFSTLLTIMNDRAATEKQNIRRNSRGGQAPEPAAEEEEVANSFFSGSEFLSSCASGNGSLSPDEKKASPIERRSPANLLIDTACRTDVLSPTVSRQSDSHVCLFKHPVPRQRGEAEFKNSGKSFSRFPE